jgi:hypothetical protein
VSQGPGARGDGDDAQRAVELAIAPTIAAVAIGAAGRGWDRCDARESREVRVALEPLGSGGSSDQDRGGEGTTTGLGGYLGAVDTNEVAGDL